WCRILSASTLWLFPCQAILSQVERNSPHFPALRYNGLDEGHHPSGRTQPMDVPARLTDLPAMHPELLWETILTATAAVLAQPGMEPPYAVALTVESVPGFGTEQCRLLVDPVGVSETRMAQVRRTYEPSRLVEVAAIALTAIGLHHAG